MKKFRAYTEKPKQILAVQYLLHGHLVEGVCSFTGCCFQDGERCYKDHIHTKVGIILLKVGDWITPDEGFSRILTHEELCRYGLIVA